MQTKAKQLNFSTSSLNHEALVMDWVTLAKFAPSGANAQPWSIHWEVIDHQIKINLNILPDYSKHPSIMDVNGHATYMALGCFTVNLEAAAYVDRFILKEINYNEHKNNFSNSIELIFQYSEKSNNLNFSKVPQINDIINRSTNRNLYSKKEIDTDKLNEILKICHNGYDTNLKFISKKYIRNFVSKIKKLDLIRWKNKLFFGDLLREIHFSWEKQKDEDLGFFIPSSQLGINKMDEFFLFLLKKISILRFLMTKIFYPVASFQSLTRPLVHSSHLGFIWNSNDSLKSGFELGRSFQRIWIYCQSQNISFQPIGLPLIAFKANSNEQTNAFSKNELIDIENVKIEVLKNYEINFDNLCIGFRIGYCDKSTPRSPRSSVNVTKKNQSASFTSQTGS